MIKIITIGLFSLFLAGMASVEKSNITFSTCDPPPNNRLCEVVNGNVPDAVVKPGEEIYLNGDTIRNATTVVGTTFCSTHSFEDFSSGFEGFPCGQEFERTVYYKLDLHTHATELHITSGTPDSVNSLAFGLFALAPDACDTADFVDPAAIFPDGAELPEWTDCDAAENGELFFSLCNLDVETTENLYLWVATPLVDEGAFELEFSQRVAPENDHCVKAATITSPGQNLVVSDLSEIVCLTNETNRWTCPADYDPDMVRNPGNYPAFYECVVAPTEGNFSAVWYEFTTDSDAGRMDVELTRSGSGGIGFTMFEPDGDCNDGFKLVVCRNSVDGEIELENYFLEPDTRYLILISSPTADAANFDLCLNVKPPKVCLDEVPYYFNHAEPICDVGELEDLCMEVGPPIMSFPWPGCDHCCAFHNPQWFVFVAGESDNEQLSIDVEITECQNNSGVQIALYKLDCDTQFDPDGNDAGINPTPAQIVSNCNLVSSPQIGIVNFTVDNVVAGTLYGIVVDGWANDECRIDVLEVIDGMEPYEIDEEKIGDILWSSDGVNFNNEDSLVAGTKNNPFKVTDSLDVECLKYNWYVNGEYVADAGDSSFALLDFYEEGLVEVCAEARNLCVSSDLICAEVYVQPSPVSLSIECVPSCPDAGDGWAEVVASGGQGPYTYLWSTGDSAQSISNLAADTVCVTVTDSQGYSNRACCTVGEFDFDDISILCPDDIFVDLPPGDTSLFVELEDAVVLYDCGQDLTVENSYTDAGANASGFYPPGVTGIEYTVQDSLGNFAECETAVTVLPMHEISGEIYYENEAALEGVLVSLTQVSGDLIDDDISGENGEYQLAAPQDFTLRAEPHLNEDHSIGLSTASLISLQRHLMGIEPLDSPYKIIAADINNDRRVSSADLLFLQSVLIGVRDEFPNNNSHRFIAADYVFENPQNPLAENWPESRTYVNLDRDTLNEDWIAVRIGKLDEPSSDFQRYSSGKVDLLVRELSNEDGTVDLIFSTYRDYSLSGYQLEFEIDLSTVDFVELDYDHTVLPGLTSNNFLFLEEEGLLRTNWFYQSDQNLKAGEEFFRLKINPTREGSEYSRLVELLEKGSLWPSEAYAGNGNFRLKPILIRESEKLPQDEYVLHPNRPNPFSGSTTISFELPAEMEVVLTFADGKGRLLKTARIDGVEGLNEWNFRDETLPDGAVYYRIIAGDWSATGKMIHVK